MLGGVHPDGRVGGNGGGQDAGKEGRVRLTREDGYYWVALPGRLKLEIAWYSSILGQWMLDGWDWMDCEDVGVASGRLTPPEERSGCVHAQVFRRGEQCIRCGTVGLNKPPR